MPLKRVSQNKPPLTLLCVLGFKNYSSLTQAQKIVRLDPFVPGVLGFLSGCIFLVDATSRLASSLLGILLVFHVFNKIYCRFTSKNKKKNLFY